MSLLQVADKSLTNPQIFLFKASFQQRKKYNDNNNNNDRLTAFDPGQPG